MARFFCPAGIALGTSMEPTMEKGALFVVNRVAYLFNLPERDDIVSIKASQVKSMNDSNSINFTKRIVAIGGDNVTFTKNELYVNDKIVGKSKMNDYRVLDLSDMPDDNEFEAFPFSESITVPHNFVFVMGDNFDNSYDSRKFGAIPLDTIDGKIIKIFGKSDD